MRNIVAKLVIGVAITTIGMYGADNSIGTWKRNVAKSKNTPPVTNPIKSLTIVNEASDGGVKVTVTGERQDGTPINSSSSVKYDGKEYPVTGGTFDTIAQKRLDENTTTFEVKMTGTAYHASGSFTVSKDGKTRTQIDKGIGLDGKPFELTRIYEKQ